MANYLIGIGGTGARVINQFVHMCACGEYIEGGVNVALIDADNSNGNVEKCKKLLEQYKENRNSIDPSSTGGFYATEINPLFKDDKESFFIDVNAANQTKFKDWLNLNNLEAVVLDGNNKDVKKRQDRNNKIANLLKLMNDSSSLDADMSIGFIGKPNVGALVMDYFFNSKFKKFFSSLGNNDTVFIISSIFGGTGASGLPLFLKNLADPTKINNKNIHVGALIVEPYFSVEQKGESPIDSRLFISKSKDALRYYDASLFQLMKNNNFKLYSIGDLTTHSQNNSIGGKTQNNSASTIELLSSTSIFHFLNPNSPKKVLGVYNYWLNEKANETTKIVGLQNTAIPISSLKNIYSYALLLMFIENYIVKKDAILKGGYRFVNDLALNTDFDTFIKPIGEMLTEFKNDFESMSQKGRELKSFQYPKEYKDGTTELIDTFVGYKFTWDGVANNKYKLMRNTQDHAFLLEDLYESLNETLHKRKYLKLTGFEAKAFMSVFYEAAQKLISKKVMEA